MGGIADLNRESSGISVSLYETEREFNQLEEDWKRLFRESPRPVPFLTWEWVSTWWRHFGDVSRLFVLVARDSEGRVIGIAPLRISTRKSFAAVPIRTVEFLGYRGSAVCPDHLDFLTTGENREPIVERLARAILAHRQQWDVAELADLAKDSLLPAVLIRLGRDQGFSIAEGPRQVCPYVRLPEHWDSFLRQIKEKRRSSIKWRRKKLLRSYSVRLNHATAVEDVHEQMETLARLHHLSRERKGDRGNFGLQKYRHFHYDVAERMAQAGYLYLARLDCDGRPVASVYGFHVGRVLFDYQKGFDSAYARDGVGSVLTGMVLEDAIERLHCTELDFLRGEEEYKYFWTPLRRQTTTLLIWGDCFSSRISRAGFILGRKLLQWRKPIQQFRNYAVARQSSSED